MIDEIILLSSCPKCHDVLFITKYIDNNGSTIMTKMSCNSCGFYDEVGM